MKSLKLQLGLVSLLLCACQPSPERLAERLLHGSPSEQVRAARRLGKMGARARPAVPALRRYLTEDHTIPELDEAALALGFIGDPQAIPELIHALESHSFSDLERLAAVSLARIGPAAVPALIDALRDSQRRYWAARALEQLGPQAAPALPALKQEYAESLEDTEFLDSVISAVGAIAQDPAAADALAFVCAALRHPHPSVRRDAARTLRDLGARGATCADLAVAAKDADREVSTYAQEALRAGSSPSSSPVQR